MGIQRWGKDGIDYWMSKEDDGRYVRFADHEQVVAELTKAHQDNLDSWLHQREEIAFLRAELAAKSKELRRIQTRATPHPDDNDDDRKRNLYHIESIAKAAMGEGNGR